MSFELPIPVGYRYGYPHGLLVPLSVNSSGFLQDYYILVLDSGPIKIKALVR